MSTVYILREGIAPFTEDQIHNPVYKLKDKGCIGHGCKREDPTYALLCDLDGLALYLCTKCLVKYRGLGGMKWCYKHEPYIEICDDQKT